MFILVGGNLFDGSEWIHDSRFQCETNRRGIGLQSIIAGSGCYPNCESLLKAFKAATL